MRVCVGGGDQRDGYRGGSPDAEMVEVQRRGAMMNLDSGPLLSTSRVLE